MYFLTKNSQPFFSQFQVETHHIWSVMLLRMQVIFPNRMWDSFVVFFFFFYNCYQGNIIVRVHWISLIEPWHLIMKQSFQTANWSSTEKEFLKKSVIFIAVFLVN